MTSHITIIRRTLANHTLIALESKGLTNSLTYFPRKIQTAELPLNVVAVRNALFDWQTYGAEQMVEDRLYELLVHVADPALGTEGHAEQECEEYISLLIDYFGRHRHIELPDDGGGIDLTPTGDAGITQFDYGTAEGRNLKSFLGVTFPLQVETELTIENAT